MSTFRAIAAVTQRLVSIASEPNVQITALPPDMARTGRNGNQINIFMFRSSINPAWRNQDLPDPGGKQQPRQPLLPLDLAYLITAYGAKTQPDVIREVFAHQILGRLMLKLHDAPEWKLKDFPNNSGIKNQVDPIRITPMPMNLDEMTKLWSSFQSAYRSSVAYEVGVVLIESDRDEVTPLPVTQRGPTDTGWDATSQLPAQLMSVQLDTQHQPGARVGERVKILGQNLLQGGAPELRLEHRLFTDPILVTPEKITDQTIVFKIPGNSPAWLAGPYQVRLQSTIAAGSGSRTAVSNALPFTILPEIVPPPAGLTVTSSGSSRFLKLPCRPSIHPDQSVEVLIGSVPIATLSLSTPNRVDVNWNTTTTQFPDGEDRFVRLKVDGVESLLIDPAKPDQGFDLKYKLEFS